MRFESRLAVRLALLVALFLAAGCGSGTQLTNVWRDSNDFGPPLKKVVVIAAKRDELRKRVWEDAFTRELRGAGLDATPAYTSLEGDVVDTTAARQFLLDGGYDAVIVVRSMGRDTRTSIIPGTTRTEAIDTYYDPFWHQFRTVYEETRTPDIEETENIYFNETSVFRPASDPTKKGHLVWAGTSESVDPQSSQEAADATAKKVILSLQANGVIGKPARIQVPEDDE